MRPNQHHRAKKKNYTHKLNQMNSKSLWNVCHQRAVRFSANVEGLSRASRKSLMREYLLPFENFRSLFLSTCRCWLFFFRAIHFELFFIQLCTRLRPHLNQLKAKIKKERKDMKNNNFSLKLKFCYDTLEIYRNSDFFFTVSPKLWLSSSSHFPCRLTFSGRKFALIWYMCVC